VENQLAAEWLVDRTWMTRIELIPADFDCGYQRKSAKSASSAFYYYEISGEKELYLYSHQTQM